MHTDKNGNEVNVGDVVDLDGVLYSIVSKGKCVDIKDEDEVLYGQMVDDMRVLMPMTQEHISKSKKKED